jgi:hypothetical protein
MNRHIIYLFIWTSRNLRQLKKSVRTWKLAFIGRYLFNILIVYKDIVIHKQNLRPLNGGFMLKTQGSNISFGLSL